MTDSLVQIESRRSPLIPRSIDNTALDAFMSCPRKYYYSMELGRRKGGSLSPALNFGTTWHAGLEAHYKTGGDAAAVRKAMIMAYQPIDDPSDHRTLERAISSYDQYLQHWGDFAAEQAGWGKTVGFPDSPVVEMATDIWWEGSRHPYAGKIDRVFEYQGLFYVEDHKTSSALGQYYFHQFDPSNQMMGYAALAQKLTGLPIAGVRINAFGCLKTQSKFDRRIIPYSPQRIEHWMQNYQAWVKKLEESYRILGTAPVGELNGVYMTPEIEDAAFPHNFNACAAKYGQCTYTEVCTQAPQLRQRVLEFEYEVLPWDPMHSADEGGES
jgi:hypothetical protein